MFRALLIAATAVSAAGMESPWRPLPVFGGGFVLNALIAPSAPSRWYAYVDVGGPYRSDDGGKTWRALHAEMPPEMVSVCADYVRGLSIDPHDADSFVMVSGDHRVRDIAGAYVTHDGGHTFRKTLTAHFYGDSPRRWSGQCIARSPLAPDVLVCGEDLDGIHRSDDNGETWRPCGLAGTWITDIRFDPDIPERLYVCAPALNERERSAASWIDPRERSFGFFRSDDGGTTWMKIMDEAPSETAQIPGMGRIIGLFDGRHVRASDDGGETWDSFEEGLPIRPDGEPTPDYIAHDRYLALAAGPDFWLVANSEGTVFRRKATEDSWCEVQCEKQTLSDPVAESHQIRNAARKRKLSLATLNVDPNNPDHWLATDWFDIWETCDAGRTWRTRVTGMSQVCPFVVSCDPNSPDNICYGMADMGMSCSNDGGNTFHSVPQTGGASSVAWCRHHPGTVFAIGGKHGIQFVRSTDSGRTWEYPPAKGLPPFRDGAAGDPETEFSAYTVAVDPVTDRVFLTIAGPTGFAAKNGGVPSIAGVYASDDLGESFTRFSDGLPEGRNLFRYGEFTGGGSSGWTPELVFGEDGSAVLSLWEGPCHYLDRMAGRWEPTVITNRHASCTVAADPHWPGRFLFADGERLRESTDGGRTWHILHESEGKARCCVAFDRFTPGLVVAVSRETVNISRDGGRTFAETLPEAFRFPDGGKRWMSVDRGRLFGLTRGSGVWVRMIDVDRASVPVDWNSAWLSGSLDRDCPFFDSGEEMAFAIRLEGVKGDIPDGAYFVDWERRGDDGIVEKGRAPLPTAGAPLVVRTKMDAPGFVCVEANVVDAQGVRVKKKHRWEPRVFFMGGAAVAPEELRPGTEPADYDDFWNAQMAALEAVPIETELTPTPCADAGVRLYAVRIACSGGRPVTGWLTIPSDTSLGKRYPVSVGFRGASTDDQPAPDGGPHDRIHFMSNGHGFELGRGPEYVKEFFASVCKPGFGYGFDPKSNSHKETSYWLGMALRAARAVQWAATLPEWDGKALLLDGTSQGGWQALMAASLVPHVTKITTGVTWGCDWTGQNEYGRLPSGYRPKCWFPDMAYFDAVFAARRVRCPVEIKTAGLGDYVSPPSSLAVLYNALNIPKKITWCQGWTHGWNPDGMAKWTEDGGFSETNVRQP